MSDPVAVVYLPTVAQVTVPATVVQVACPGPQGPPGPAGPQGPAGPPGAGTGRVQLTATAATALSGHRAVRPRPDGTVEYADATDPAHLHGPVWVTVGAASAGASVEMVAYGQMVEPSWTWTPGLPVFLATAGVLTQTPPVAPPVLFLTRLGVATAADTLFVDLHPSIALVLV